MITISTPEELDSLVGRNVIVSPLIVFPISLPVSSIEKLKMDKSLSLQQVMTSSSLPPPVRPTNPHTQFPFEDEYEVNGRPPLFNPMNGYGESDRQPAMTIPWGSGGRTNGGGMYPDLNLGSQFPNPGSQGPRWDPPMGPSGGFNGSF